MKKIILSFILIVTCTFGQTKRDARVVGLAGTYTTIADGIFSVGYNPALIGFQQHKPFQWQLFGFDTGVIGNFISFETIAEYSGDTLYTADKDKLFENFEDAGGLTFFQDFHLPIPALNFTSGNLAFTSNAIFLSNFKLPIGLLEMMMYGNANKPELDMTLGYEILGLNEYGLTFAIPLKNVSTGVTLKYLQGLFYMGIDPETSYANLITDDKGLYGSGRYLLRQGMGGAGFGLDIGIVTKEFQGWTFGSSLINAIGTIAWNKTNSVNDDGPSITVPGIYPFTWEGEELGPNEAVLYTYKIDTIRADKLSQDSLFYNNSEIILDTTNTGEGRVFETRYPATFRMGLSKRTETFIFASDLVTGFINEYYSIAKWRWSLGAEWTKLDNVPIRFGYSWAGGDLRELSMGIGIHKGPIIFDLGFAFRNGVWISSMRGFNFSLGLTITSPKSRKPLKPGQKRKSNKRKK
ncbi:MAG: hypothetical protein HOK52_12385 [Candidatus Marinimicrobia bacterium]|jgi:hypothetical protein|nr:hypothetical protein [Candidatus Neomarinimicrobiota bacterium]MBT3937206.1 hypothetical protein [Candidatus Neomarinimicrobiota bacterium]MBT3960842.1 hypothetical protein [Candidatus Neomarinimicrobiota bacterium]MBT4383570.1 hypothetical protein [Candidatus Neomarinimicrobiota bacterium]MBT4636834.1 hypothetical protein [Candidatus Neomarinimicrobiota bacterium]